MRGGYSIMLLAALTGMTFIDRRFALAYFHNQKRTVYTICSAVLFFIVWDVIGIGFNIFFIGPSRWLIGLRIGQFPLEELLFLTLLTYNALLLFRWFEMKADKRR